MRRRLTALAERATAPVGSITRIAQADDAVVLTFDDGPREPTTSRILDALAQRGASATFFVLLTRARRDRESLATLSAAGHEVALHGVDHRPMPTFSPAENLARLRDGRRELEDLVGLPVRWMRPPYGRQRPGDWLAIRRAGLEPVMWTRTTWDTRVATPSERLGAATDDVRGGDILLAHDGYADITDGVDDGPEPQFSRAELISAILDGYAERGLRGVSLARALADGGTPTRRAWFSR